VFQPPAAAPPPKELGSGEEEREEEEERGPHRPSRLGTAAPVHVARQRLVAAPHRQARPKESLVQIMFDRVIFINKLKKVKIKKLSTPATTART
jgi:hypothetical protein